MVLYGGQGTSSTSNWSFGLCRSTNGGVGWTRSFIDQGARGFALALAVAPSGPDTVYAGGWIVSAGAVALSTDRGVTWSRTASAPPETVFGLTVRPDNAAHAYAATTGGVYRTTDAGASWSRVHHLVGMRAIAFYPGCPDTIIAAGDPGVVASFDGGQSWSSLNAGLDEHPVVCLEFTSLDAVYLYAGTADGAAYRYSFQTGIEESASDDLGMTNGGLPMATIAHGVLYIPETETTKGQYPTLLDAAGRRAMDLRTGPNDVRHLSPGVYFLRREAGVRTSRIIIAR